jgi:hypothetical protein
MLIVDTEKMHEVWWSDDDDSGNRERDIYMCV